MRPYDVANGETRRLILDRLRREADMDGGAILSLAQIAGPLELTRPAVHYHLQSLLAEGVIARDTEVEVDHAGARLVAYRMTPPPAPT